MSKEKSSDKLLTKAKKDLGKLITKQRKDMSARQLANIIGLPPSNLKYIEDGVNAPTAEVYSKIAAVLWPDFENRKTADKLFMAIRKTPPPDVCEAVINSPYMIDVIRNLNDSSLNDSQISALNELINSFALENTKGENDNG